MYRERSGRRTDDGGNRLDAFIAEEPPAAFASHAPIAWIRVQLYHSVGRCLAPIFGHRAHRRETIGQLFAADQVKRVLPLRFPASRHFLIQVLLEACKDSPDFLGLAEVGHGVGDRVMVFEPKQRRELFMVEFFHSDAHVVR